MKPPPPFLASFSPLLRLEEELCNCRDSVSGLVRGDGAGERRAEVASGSGPVPGFRLGLEPGLGAAHIRHMHRLEPGAELASELVVAVVEPAAAAELAVLVVAPEVAGTSLVAVAGLAPEAED